MAGEIWIPGGGAFSVNWSIHYRDSSNRTRRLVPFQNSTSPLSGRSLRQVRWTADGSGVPQLQNIAQGSSGDPTGNVRVVSYAPAGYTVMTGGGINNAGMVRVNGDNLEVAAYVGGQWRAYRFEGVLV